MGKGLHQTINGLGTQKTKEYLKDAQSALLIKEMQINIIIKDFYVILAKKKKKKLSNSKYWKRCGDGKALTTGEGAEWCNQLTHAPCLPTDTEE